MSYVINYHSIKGEKSGLYKFSKFPLLIDFIDEVTIRRKGECIWLIAREGTTDIFISESALSIQTFIEKMDIWKCVGDYFLMEFDSFEEAYKVALNMNEGHELCYSNQ